MSAVASTTFTRRVWLPIKGECPACGHRGWCTASQDGEVIKCQRAESAHPVKQKDGSTAYLHLTGEIKLIGKVQTSMRKPAKRLRQTEIEVMLRNYKTAISPQRLSRLSEKLGVSETSLTKYGVGYATDYSARTAVFSAPMYDGQKRVCGIHLRSEAGGKFAVPGSRNGLFLPEDFELFETHEGDSPIVLVTPEGLTDCCAAFDLGFRAIGRPSAAGGADELLALLSSGPKQEVFIFADNDSTKYLKDGTPLFPGIEGAVSVCQKILPACDILKFVMPPAGVKDLRQWFGKGSRNTMKLIREAVFEGIRVTPDWLERAKARILDRKRKERKQPK